MTTREGDGKKQPLLPVTAIRSEAMSAYGISSQPSINGVTRIFRALLVARIQGWEHPGRGGLEGHHVPRYHDEHHGGRRGNPHS